MDPGSCADHTAQADSWLCMAFKQSKPPNVKALKLISRSCHPKQTHGSACLPPTETSNIGRHCRLHGVRMPCPQQVCGVDHVQRAKAERGLPERAPCGLPGAAPARAAAGRAQARRARKTRRQRPGGAPLGRALACMPSMAFVGCMATYFRVWTCPWSCWTSAGRVPGEEGGCVPWSSA